MVLRLASGLSNPAGPLLHKPDLPCCLQGTIATVSVT